VALPNAGSYSVVVTNSAGTVASNSVTLDVAPAGYLPPSITSEPSTVIVAAGGAATLAVGAAGSGPLSYQWSFNGTPIPGATLPVLTLTNVGSAHVGDYTVLVANGTDSVNSQVAALILLGAPAISQDPESATAYEGQSATLIVNADGSGLRYQWMLNGSPISGATEASYTTPMLVSANSGAVYSVAVYNGAGLVTSASAVLTVQVNVIPTVLQQPASVTIQPDQRASLCVAFSGTLPLTLHMQRWNGTSWASILDILATSNDPNCFFTPNLTVAETGAQFRFAADNPAGQVVTSTAIVTVTAPFAITTTMLASRATSGATANNRSGLPSLSADGNIVAFISDGTNLVPGFGGYPLASINGYVRNMTTGVTTLVNQTPAGTQSQSPYGLVGLKVAAGGRHVIFTSLANDLVADDTNGSQDVFVRDLQTGITKRVSLRADGTELEFYGNGQGDMQVNISADGSRVSFVSNQDLIGDDPSGAYKLYFRDLRYGTLRRVFSSTTSLVAYSTMSDNGLHMAYLYGTFAPGDTHNYIVHYDIDQDSRAQVFSIDSTNDVSYVAQGIGLSASGKYVTFAVHSPALFNGSAFTQVVAIDLQASPDIVVASSGSFGFGDDNSMWPKVSEDGHVIFETKARNLTANFTNSQTAAIVVRDLRTTEVKVASRRPNGTSIAPLSGYAYHAISSDGTAVAFVADEFDMSGGGAREHQVYVAPRP